MLDRSNQQILRVIFRLILARFILILGKQFLTKNQYTVLLSIQILLSSCKKSSKNVKKRLQEKRRKGHFGANLAFSTQNLKKQKFSVKKPYIMLLSIHSPLKKDLMTRIWGKKLAPSVTLLGNKEFPTYAGLFNIP